MQPTQLSVIIVSYNVSAFLEKCLESVLKASDGMTCDVWVVDNHSVDETVLMVQEKFPTVKLIKNEENVGFATANNQAIKHAQGKYILLLNPDTIVSEDCFHQCLEYMGNHEDCGALGVKMYDGSGAYLPESKRGFPTPWASFTKMTGLYRLFPKSEFWNSYYMGHLDVDETHSIDVLTGAFMLIPKEVFNQIGGLDESFFMYGEDIDLSYRIKNAEYEIYYFPHTSIIHYKGESTKKASLDYVRTFYKAMIIFAQKHFTGTRSWLMIQLLKMAIYFAAVSSFLTRAIKRLAPLLLDLIIAGISVLVACFIWARYYFMNAEHFDADFYRVNLPLYAIIATISVYLNRAHRPFGPLKSFFRSVCWSIITILIVYALLPLNYRSSRFVVFLSMLLFLLIGSLVRRLAYSGAKTSQNKKGGKRILFVGNHQAYQKTRQVIDRSVPGARIIGAMSLEPDFDREQYINHIGELNEVARINQVDEIIFSTDDVDFTQMTRLMTELGPGYQYKISSDQSWEIIGSDSKNASGEFYGLAIKFNIDTPGTRSEKRSLDIAVSIVLLVLFPLILILTRQRIGAIRNIFAVISGRLSWVGYHGGDPQISTLPKMRQGILEAYSEMIASTDMNTKKIHNYNYLYAKDYRLWYDIEHIFANLRDIGKRISQ